VIARARSHESGGDGYKEPDSAFRDSGLGAISD
jgi:hypothetical protein